jgi:hypothetical protein
MQNNKLGVARVESKKDLLAYWSLCQLVFSDVAPMDKDAPLEIV